MEKTLKVCTTKSTLIKKIIIIFVLFDAPFGYSSYMVVHMDSPYITSHIMKFINAFLFTKKERLTLSV